MLFQISHILLNMKLVLAIASAGQRFGGYRNKSNRKKVAKETPVVGCQGTLVCEFTIGCQYDYDCGSG